MGIWKDKETKNWIYKFQFRGKFYGERGFISRREAEAARIKRRSTVESGIKTLEKATKTATDFSNVTNDYLDIAQRKFVKDVYKRKANVFRDFLKSLDRDIPVDQIIPRHVKNYLNTLEGNSLYNENRHELSALFNWVKKTYIDKIPFFVNPCLGVETMPYESEEKMPPTSEEVSKIIEAANEGDELDIILICLHTLARIDEVWRLRWKEDINFDKRVVTLWTRKRRNGELEPDDIPMNDDLYSILSTRWECRKQDKWVIYNEATKDRYYHRHNLMSSICARAGLKPLKVSKQIKGGHGKTKDVPIYYGFHSLRHFMASYLLDEENVSLGTVSRLLRHKNVRTTEGYLHPADHSKIAATAKINGKFTRKTVEPPRHAATFAKKSHKKGLVNSTNP